MYFLDGTYYKVRATDKYGKFVGAGEIVNIKIRVRKEAILPYYLWIILNMYAVDRKSVV